MLYQLSYTPVLTMVPRPALRVNVAGRAQAASRALVLPQTGQRGERVALGVSMKLKRAAHAAHSNRVNILPSRDFWLHAGSMAVPPGLALPASIDTANELPQFTAGDLRDGA